MKKFLKFLIFLIILGGSIYYLYFYLGIRIYKIDGTSMVPTFKNGELVISMKDSNIQRKDIVVYQYKNANIIKRIIGLPGETIDIKEDGSVYINDTLLKENYLVSTTNPGEVAYPHNMNVGEYFVIGDNRLDSFDSRYVQVGNINSSNIKGRVVFSINTFRIFNHEK